MLCQKCNKNEATGIIKQTINGKTTEMHLCAQCMQQMGFLNMGNLAESLDIGKIFGGLFNMMPSAQITAANVRKCKMCGATLHDFVKEGKAGCPACYEEFAQGVLPVIQRIHGNVQHKGKIPRSAGGEISKKRELKELKLQLTKAISEQEFEKAAQLRDRIREIEKENGAES
ncbi:MAG: hypothetical protein E7491_09460 [Ruminococcaceae bacterium]|nr:hypothetical protein [Oscillospiraceae bacterium]